MTSALSGPSLMGGRGGGSNVLTAAMLLGGASLVGAPLFGSDAAPALDIAQTWNTTGTPTAFRLNVTDNGSNASSVLMNLLVGGASRFYVTKSGNFGNAYCAIESSGRIYSGNLGFRTIGNADGTWFGRSLTVSGMGAGNAFEVYLSSGLWEQKGSTQTFRLYGAFTDASNYRRLAISSTTAGAFSITPEGLGTGATGNTLAINGPVTLKAVKETTIDLGTVTTASTISIAEGTIVKATLTANTTCAFTMPAAEAGRSFVLMIAQDATTGNGGATFAGVRWPLGLAPTLTTTIGRTDIFSFTSDGTYWYGSAGRNYSAEVNTDPYNAPLDGQALLWNQSIQQWTPQTIQALTGPVTLSGPTLTGSAATSALAINQIWNTTGTPTALSVNVTDTASNASSLLMDLRVGGTSRFSVRKDGRTTLSNGLDVPGIGSVNTTGASISWAGVQADVWRYLGIGVLGQNPTVTLYRDADDTLAQRRGTNAQTFRLYGTYTDSSNYERGFMRWASNVLEIGTEAAGTGTGRNLVFRAGTVQTLTLPASGTASFSGSMSASSVVAFNGGLVSSGSGSARFCRNGIGTVLIDDSSSGTAAPRNVSGMLLQFGGATGTAPALKRAELTSTLQIRTADDAGFAPLEASAVTVQGNTFSITTARTPASATAAGNQGDICWDADYIYTCVAANTWKRAALSTW